MRTEQLIQAMAADTARSRPLGPVLALAVLAAAAAVALVALPMLGPRPDLGAVLMQAQVLVKQAVPLILAIGAFGAALRLARPGMSVGGWALVLAAGLAVLVVAVSGEMMALPEAAWMPAMMGQTNRQCLVFTAAMGLLPLAGVLWALRRGASTRPALSGAVGGLLAGGVAAALHAVHCTEDSPLFYAVWHGLAILSLIGLGALLGRLMLRW
jgi:hypothetical protein